MERIEHFTNVTIDQAGRILIPSALRKELDLKPGDTLSLSTGQYGQIELTSRLQALKKAQDYLAKHAPSNANKTSVVDDLITMRREEARLFEEKMSRLFPDQSE